MAFNPDNYFDISNILIYEIIGAPSLAIAVGMVLISYFCLRYAVPFQTTIALFVLYGLIFAVIFNYIWLWALIEVAVGGLFYWVFIKVMKRG